MQSKIKFYKLKIIYLKSFIFFFFVRMLDKNPDTRFQSSETKLFIETYKTSQEFKNDFGDKIKTKKNLINKCALL